MAATGKTPILLYGSITASNVPVAGNLTNSSDGCEIAINVADKNLFFKDSTNVVNTVPIRQSSGSSDGWLSSANWTTFNSKQAAYTNLTSIGSLANATGWLYNNGSGTFSYSTPTASDVGATQRTSFPSNSNASVIAGDNRTLTNPSTGIGYSSGMRVRFGSMNEDNNLPYADVIDLSTYSNSTGGGYNSLYFSKSTQQLTHKFATAGSTSWTTKNIAYSSDTLAQFAPTTSAQLAGVISDETGTGALVFAGSPVTSNITNTALLVNPVNTAIFTTAKFNSQGVAWSADTTLNSYIFNGSATQRPEVSWYRGSRTYPELSIRQHTTNDTGGEVYAGPGTVAPTKVAEIKSTGWTFVGDTTLSTGNLVIGTSGKGIDFSATAGTGTSELLADYEEGTFTPVIAGSTSAGTGTYSTQSGIYTKTGNVVYFQIRITWSAHTGTGTITITGLPYTSGATALGSCTFGYLASFAWTAGNTPTAYVATSGTSISLRQTTAAGVNSGIPMSGTGDIAISGFYRV